MEEVLVVNEDQWGHMATAKLGAIWKWLTCWGGFRGKMTDLSMMHCVWHKRFSYVGVAT